MTVTAWRITKQKLARDAFSGEGAREYGGRWNHPGVAVVYTAQFQSLAALEILVHLDAAELLGSYALIAVEIDETLIQAAEKSRLPDNWAAPVAPEETRAWGDAWVQSASSAALQVPSVLVPDESNYLLNPAHPDFSRLRFSKPRPFHFDPRLRSAPRKV